MGAATTFEGVFPILVTPFHANGQLDLQSFDRLIRFMVELGVDGVTILGVLGESNRVTDRERDYMYRLYAQDHQMRINVGIRRRLAPLLNNDRNKIELMNGLLFSLPGTPVLYYGDEIGMGDNFYLGDRNGVRTPMQWSADRSKVDIFDARKSWDWIGVSHYAVSVHKNQVELRKLPEGALSEEAAKRLWTPVEGCIQSAKAS